MAKKIIKLTSSKYKQLNDELEEIKTIGRKLIADKLEVYRVDASTEDSVNYNSLLEEKMAMEERATKLEDILEDAEIADECSLTTVEVGCIVTLNFGGTERKFQVVSSMEANPEEGKISENSPIGMAVVGHKVGEEVECSLPGGDRKCKIVSIG